jgi:hypothetical protein
MKEKKVVLKIKLIAAALLFATSAQADLRVEFSEGAPTDKFTITTTDSCISGPVVVEFDLSGSSGKLIFDITAKGAGVEVFQPLIFVSGKADVTSTSAVTDGDRVLSLNISSLTPESPIAFTTDVDDTIGQREITVSGSEIAGATVKLTTPQQSFSAKFQKDAAAIVDVPDCNS